MTNDKALYQNYNISSDIPLTMAASPECIFCRILSDVLPQTCPKKKPDSGTCRRNVRCCNNQNTYTIPLNTVDVRMNIQN